MTLIRQFGARFVFCVEGCSVLQQSARNVLSRRISIVVVMDDHNVWTLQHRCCADSNAFFGANCLDQNFIYQQAVGPVGFTADSLKAGAFPLLNNLPSTLCDRPEKFGRVPPGLLECIDVSVRGDDGYGMCACVCSRDRISDLLWQRRPSGALPGIFLSSHCTVAVSTSADRPTCFPGHDCVPIQSMQHPLSLVSTVTFPALIQLVLSFVSLCDLVCNHRCLQAR